MLRLVRQWELGVRACVCVGREEREEENKRRRRDGGGGAFRLSPFCFLLCFLLFPPCLRCRLFLARSAVVATALFCPMCSESINWARGRAREREGVCLESKPFSFFFFAFFPFSFSFSRSLSLPRPFALTAVLPPCPRPGTLYPSLSWPLSRVCTARGLRVPLPRTRPTPTATTVQMTSFFLFWFFVSSQWNALAAPFRLRPMRPMRPMRSMRGFHTFAGRRAFRSSDSAVSLRC